MNRRKFLNNAMLALAGFSISSKSVLAEKTLKAPLQSISNNTYLDKSLNLELPKGCKAKIIARSGQTVIDSSNYRWHAAPDGGACFTSQRYSGGWIYVSNSELNDKLGGVGALHFDSRGVIKDAYSILTNTTRNCAGGTTPWGTWLSCEENKEAGQVYECDPHGENKALVRPALGSFNHEAVAVDPQTGFLYLTEDVKDSAFYRFIPDKPGDLSKGKLQVAVNVDNNVVWKTLADPEAKQTPTRYQIKNVIQFKGTEGIIYDNGNVFFTTKIDNKVWSYAIKAQRFEVIYDPLTSENPILSGVDNIEVAPSGELLIAEDGGDMQIVGIGLDGTPFPLVTIYQQDRSEITGPAFSPDGSRLYFSSQRGETGNSENGITYELTFAS